MELLPVWQPIADWVYWTTLSNGQSTCSPTFPHVTWGVCTTDKHIAMEAFYDLYTHKTAFCSTLQCQHYCVIFQEGRCGGLVVSALLS